MSKLKVTIVVGTRPEIIRLSRIIHAVKRELDLTLVHTGQNYDYELNEIFFEDLDIPKPDFFLEAAGDNAAITIANTIVKFDEVLASNPTDAILVLGDTNSCLSAIAAKRRKIPVFHMEAGNRCFDQRVPEEINRKIVDHISDINMTYSDIAREHLLREGLPADRIIKTGSPMFEVLSHYQQKIDDSDVLERLQLVKEEFIVVSAHREENITSEKCFNNLVAILNQIAQQYEKPIIFAAHPRTRNMIEKKGVQFDSRISIMKPLSFTEFVCLQKNSMFVLSDGGTISEESSILNFPALNIREAHERAEAMEEASVIMTGLNPERVSQAIQIILKQPRGNQRLLRPVADYSMPNVSDKVIRILLSYTDYVNRVVWQKR